MRTILAVVTCFLFLGVATAELQNVQVGGGPHVLSVSKALEEHGVPLFNGENLSGWWIRGGDEDSFTVRDGNLVVTGEGAQNWIFTDKEYGRFILGYEYRCVSGKGNSGVAIQAAKEGNPAFTGMEFQVIRPGWPIKWQRTCALYSTVPPSVEADKPFGEWNSVIVYSGLNHIQTTLNGHVLYDIMISDFTREFTADFEWQQPLADRADHGHVAIQNHGDHVEFRNIKIVDFGAINAPRFLLTLSAGENDGE